MSSNHPTPHPTTTDGEIRIGFWNLQNLFDTSGSEIAATLEYTPADGWNRRVVAAKIANLAQVIRWMHGGRGPDLLGICEVETAALAKQLMETAWPGRYALADDDSPDLRGLDVALLYDRHVFELTGAPVSHVVHLRFPTRDIFEVPLRVRRSGAELIVLVNHWPSRRDGTYESQPFRMTVASFCGQLTNQHLKVSRRQLLALPDDAQSQATLDTRWNRNVLVMGDFNDAPFDRSVREVLRASSGQDRLEEEIKPAPNSHLPRPKTYLERQAFLFNLMWPMLGIPDEGSFYYGRDTNTMHVLDQMMVSRGLFFGLQGLQVCRDQTAICKPPMMKTQRAGRPKMFDRHTRKGCSDHFPIEGALRIVPPIGD